MFNVIVLQFFFIVICVYIKKIFVKKKRKKKERNSLAGDTHRIVIKIKSRKGNISIEQKTLNVL